MLVSKSFLVTGSTLNKDGRTERTICREVDAVLQKFYAENPGKLVGLETNLNYGGMSGTDTVFLVVTVNTGDEPDEPKEEGKISKFFKGKK